MIYVERSFCRSETLRFNYYTHSIQPNTFCQYFCRNFEKYLEPTELFIQNIARFFKRVKNTKWILRIFVIIFSTSIRKLPKIYGIFSRKIFYNIVVILHKPWQSRETPMRTSSTENFKVSILTGSKKSSSPATCETFLICIFSLARRICNKICHSKLSESGLSDDIMSWNIYLIHIWTVCKCNQINWTSHNKYFIINNRADIFLIKF